MDAPELRDACRVLEGFPRPWWVAGGWAIDLFLGRKTRPHGDVDLAVLRDSQGALRRHLSGWQLSYVVPGRMGSVRPWEGERRLEPPIHEVRAHRAAPEPTDLELLLNESAGELWRYRRDPEVTLPLERVGMRGPGGLPHLAPEVVLLYKAKEPRAADEADFSAAEPALSIESRRWLARALERCHPGHPWRDRL